MKEPAFRIRFMLSVGYITTHICVDLSIFDHLNLDNCIFYVHICLFYVHICWFYVNICTHFLWSSWCGYLFTLCAHLQEKISEKATAGKLCVCVDSSLICHLGLALIIMVDCPTHTSYLSFFLHRQIFLKIKFTPKFIQ